MEKLQWQEGGRLCRKRETLAFFQPVEGRCQALRASDGDGDGDLEKTDARFRYEELLRRQRLAMETFFLLKAVCEEAKLVIKPSCL